MEKVMWSAASRSVLFIKCYCVIISMMFIFMGHAPCAQDMKNASKI
jgi:hypothetical protein